MPKISKRQRFLSDLQEGMKYYAMLHLLEDEFATVPYEFEDGEHLEAFITFAAYHFVVSSNRYLAEREVIMKSKDFVHNYFLELPPDQFRQVTRITRSTFDELLLLIQQHEVFHNNSITQQAFVHWQLACALDRLGNDGQGVSHARSKFIWGIAQGTVHLYTQRVLTAICSLQSRFIQWPNAESRRRTSQRMALKGFKGAVAFIDGTTIPLHKKPAEDGNFYLDRKCKYSVNAQVVCDDKRRILYFFTGYPRSVGDSIVFGMSELGKNLELVLSEDEYIIADSGYGLTHRVIVPYKENSMDNPNDQDERASIDRFNTFLAKARVVNEHTIGILKSRWTSLRGMRVDIHKGIHMKRFVKQALACVILHNFCIGRDEWQEDLSTYVETEEDIADSNEANRLSLSIGQRKRMELRKACLAFHDGCI